MLLMGVIILFLLIRSISRYFRFRNQIVRSMTALIVCMRFSASSNTSDWADSKTSSVTSISEIPNFSEIFFPIVVFRSWNAGRQCIKIACSPAFSMIAFVTWYGDSSRILSSQTSSGSPMDTHTSV